LKVVSNSSVLIALSRIGQLALLSQRFKEGILIPQAVWQEVVETGKGRQGANEVKAADWITVCEVIKNQPLLTLLHTDLDKGESEAIALCVQEQADVILLDERKARRKAVSLDLTVLGTVGILIWAKRAGLIENLRQQLNILQTTGHFRLSRTVYEQALQSVGETLDDP
jgi:predicted nucleic acid-binding protein